MTILAAIDGDEGTADVVAEASRLAEKFNEPLHVLFAYERAEHSSLVTENITIKERRRLDDDEIQLLASDLASEAAMGVTDQYEAIGRRGNPAEEIVAHADDTDASYIVIGGKRRSPAGKALFGSVTQSVLLDTDRPVLVVAAD